MSPRVLTPIQDELSKRRAIAPVPTIVIETFSDYTAQTPLQTYHFSDTAFEFDGDQYLPFLIEISTLSQEMDHLPDPDGNTVGQLFRDFEFRLRNGEYLPTGKRLIVELEDNNIQFALVTFGQVLLERLVGETEGESIATAVAANEATFYRGEVTTIGAVDQDQIPISCLARLFSGGLDTDVITDDTVTGDFQGIGQRHQVVYGIVDRVPSLAVKVGGLTTLRLRMNADATEFFVSDPTVLDQAAGTVYIAGEPIEYAGVTGDRVFSLTRNPSLSSEHFIGDTVAFVPGVITYSVAANASAIGDVFVRNPINGVLLQVSSAITKLIADQNTIPGQVFSSVSWTAAAWRETLDNWVTNARVTAQASYESGTPPASGNDSANNGTASSEFQAQGRVDDGNWSAEEWTWTSDSSGPKRMKRKGPFVAANPTRGVSRFRMIASVDVTDSTGTTKADFVITYINSGLGINRTDTFSVLAVQQHDVEGAWVNTDPAAVTVGDVDGGTWEYGWGDVDPDDGVATYVGEVLTIGFEYDFIDAADLIELATPAVIQAQSGGAGVEMYCNIQGPLVPISFVAGYDFDTGTGWSVTNCAQTDGITFQIFKADETTTVEFTLNGDAINWTSSQGSNSDVVVATVDALRITTNVDGPGNGTRTFTARDWSNTTYAIDVYLDSTKIEDLLLLEFRIEDTGGPGVDFHVFRFPVGDIPKDVWTTITMNLADPPSDPHFFFTSGVPDMATVDKMFFDVLDISGSTHPAIEVNYSNIVTAGGDHDNFNAQINPGASSTDLDATGDVYRLTVKTVDWGTFDQAVLKFSNENVTHPTGPTNFKQLTFDPASLQGGVLTPLELTAVDVGTPSVDNVRTIRLEVDGLVVSVGTIELHDLSVADPTNPYVDAVDSVVQHPADVVRHFLTERAGVAASQIDATTWTTAGTNLGTNKVATILSELSQGDVQAMLKLGYDHRFQLVQFDSDTETVYRLLTAEADYTWTASIRTLTEWQDFTREGRDGSELVNRRLFVYSLDRSVSDPIAGYRRALQVDAQINDLSPSLPTSVLTASEAAIGPRLASAIAFLAIVEDATAEEVAEFYVREELREARIYTLIGVPWVQAFDLERGDIVDFVPEWDSVSINARIILVEKNITTELVTLRAVEVPV